MKGRTLCSPSNQSPEINPMFVNKCMGLGYRIVSGYCSEGEHKKELKEELGTSMILCFEKFKLFADKNIKS